MEHAMQAKTLLILSATLLLSACGANKMDRAAGGAAIGAATGAVVGSAVGAPVAGAIWGAGAGAVVGGVTGPEDIDLGQPWWR